MPGKMAAWMALFLLAWLAWTAWQPPFISAADLSVTHALPERSGSAAVQWRVLTRRMIVPKAADAMQQTLVERQLPAIALKRQEQVELHAFDDPRSFAKREEAVAARNLWKKAGFEAELIKPDAHFGVALGRLYLVAYAQQLQRRLDKENRVYTYHRRQLSIPTWRFTFPPLPYTEAKTLWLKVQETGVADPVLMRESRFQRTFGRPSGDSPQL
ncbi:MAG: hypothetical protein R8K53_05925 [Mariprofundaceae bacterium]